MLKQLAELEEGSFRTLEYTFKSAVGTPHIPDSETYRDLSRSGMDPHRTVWVLSGSEQALRPGVGPVKSCSLPELANLSRKQHLVDRYYFPLFSSKFTMDFSLIHCKFYNLQELQGMVDPICLSTQYVLTWSIIQSFPDFFHFVCLFQHWIFNSYCTF